MTFTSNGGDIAFETYINKILFTGSAFLFAYLLFLMPIEVLAPLIIILLGISLAIIVIIMVEPENFRFLFSLFMLSFGIRVFIALVVFLLSYQYGVTEGFLFKGDAHCYSERAWYAAQCYRWEVPIDFYHMAMVAGGSTTNYDLWCAWIYSLIGKNPLFLILINCVAGSLAIIFIYSLAKKLFGGKVAFYSSFLAAFWPSLIMWSAQNLRDPLVNLALILFFYLYLNFKKRFNIFHILMAMFPLYVLWKLSLFVVVAILFSIPLSILWSIKFFKKNIFFLVVIAFMVFFLGGDFIYNKLRSLYPSLAGIGGYDSFFVAMNMLRSPRAEGNLAILPNLDISTATNAFLYMPIGLLYTWFSPFPWQMGSAFQIMAVPEMIIFYLLLPYLVRGILFSYRESWKDTSILILFMAIMSLIFAFIEGNSGTLFRHRSMLLYFAFIFISSGFYEKTSENTKTLKSSIIRENNN